MVWIQIVYDFLLEYKQKILFKLKDVLLYHISYLTIQYMYMNHQLKIQVYI